MIGMRRCTFSNKMQLPLWIIGVIMIISFHFSNFSYGLASLFSIDSNPFGMSFKDWTVRWWQWALSIPQSENPLSDESGKHCNQNQNYSNVWFLAGNPGGKSERQCTIPAGKAILIPIINIECSKAEEPTMDQSQLIKCTTEWIDTVRDLTLKVDGTQLPILQEYRINSSGLFDVSFPLNNIYSVSAGDTSRTSDGYWAFLKPLSPGTHKIEFTATAGDITSTSTKIIFLRVLIIK